MPVVEHHKLSISGHAGRLMASDVFWLDNNLPKPLVVYVHGFCGFKDWGGMNLIAYHMAMEGFVFVKMNLSHNGTTPEQPENFADLEAFGRNNYSIESEDIQHVLDALLQQEHVFSSVINAGQLALIGHSRGGALAILQAARDHRVKTLITWASVAHCKTPWGNWTDDKIIKWKEDGVIYYSNQRTGQDLPLYYQLYEDYVKHQENLDLSMAMKQIRIPVLILHGSRDTSVLPEAAEKLKSWCDQAISISLETDHTFGRKHPWTFDYLPEATIQCLTHTSQFLKKHFNL